MRYVIVVVMEAEVDGRIVDQEDLIEQVQDGVFQLGGSVSVLHPDKVIVTRGQLS